MSRFQGIGTAYYGKSKRDTGDNSYITTEWFVLFLLPIFPLKSLRVIKLGKTQQNYIVAYSHSVGYKILHEIQKKNNLPQIFMTYLFTYGGIILYIGSWFLLQINDALVIVPGILTVAFLVWALVNGE